MFRTLRFALLLSIIVLAGRSTSAQVATGTPPFGSFAGGPDIINLANLNSHLPIPVLHKAGRGTNFTYDLSYDSSVWYPAGATGSQSWQPVGNWGWRGQTEAATGYVSYFPVVFNCSGGQHYTFYTEWAYHDSFGAAHFISGVTESSGGTGCGIASPNLNGTATDGSGYVINITNLTSAIVYSSSGTKIVAPILSTSGSANFTDRNGNQLTADSSGHFYDTLSSTTPVLTVSGAAPNPVTFTYTSSAGGAASYTMKYTTFTVKTNFGCGIAEYGPISNNLVTELDLPDSSSYTFTYEPTPGFSGDVTGRLASVTLPTGGTINYTYTGGSSGHITCADGSASGLTRQTPDGIWTYARTSGSGAAYTTTATDPQSNVSVIQFQGIYETQRQVYQGSTSGTLLRTVNTCYNSAAIPCTSTAIALPISHREIETNQQGIVDHHAENLNSVGMPTWIDDYDFGNGSFGPLIKRTLITYASIGNATAFSQTSIICNGSGSASACNGTGTPVARVDTNYDQTTPTCVTGAPQHDDSGHGCSFNSRANATSITTYTNPSAPSGGLTQTLTYDTLGNVRTVKDAANNTTTLVYSPDAWGNTACPPSATTYAFPVSASNALSQNTTFKYFACTGQLASVTDPNSKTTSFTYDSLLRPTQSNLPDGGQTTIAYTDTGNINVETKQKIDASRTTDSFVYFDGLGRESRRMAANGESTPWDQVDTCYDSLGRISFTSNPYQGNGLSTPKVCSAAGDSLSYDALNRTTQVTHADSTSILASYTGRAAQAQDEGNGTRRVSRVSQIDSLGRIVSLCEVSAVTLPVGTSPTPGACGQDIAATGFLTTYAYDALGNLTSVTQPGLNGRSFTYDGLSRLTSSTTPEAGTVNYSFDLDSACPAPNSFAGDLVKRLDARGVRTCMQYDALHRLTQKNYSDGTATASFFYDQTSALGVTLTNTIGRESSESTASPNPTSQAFSYDSMGRIIQNNQCTPFNCGTSTWALTYTYDLTGNMLTSTNGSGTTFTYTYNTAPRLASLTSSQNDANHPPHLLSALHYNAAAELTGATLGNGLNETRTYDSRFRPVSISAGSVYTVTIPTSGGFAPNSNILAANDSVNGNWTYSYDDFNRLAAGNATGQAYTWDYDRYGNRWHQNGPNSAQYAFDANNHVPSGYGLIYDAAGDITNDGTTTFTYDAENRMTSATNTSRGLTCYIYNAEGQRVRKT